MNIEQIAANQSYAEQLRDALEYHQAQTRPIQQTLEALALPQDTTALESMIAKAGEVMRERCVEECDEAREAIRALPGVTMEDLKNGRSKTTRRL